MTNGKQNSKETKMQNLDKLFDEMLEGVDLPSNDEIARETKNANISKAKKGKAWTKPDNYDEIMKINNQQMAQTNEWIKAHAKGMKENAKNLDWKKNVSEANRRKAQDPEWLEANLKGAQKKVNNPNWKESVKRRAKKRCKSIQTPDGIFESRNAAAEFYGKDPAVISGRMKKYPDQYYYIDDKSAE